MAKNVAYKVLQGIDYPPAKRAEAGDVVTDLPKDAIVWLVEAGAIVRVTESVEEVVEEVFEEEFVLEEESIDGV